MMWLLVAVAAILGLGGLLAGLGGLLAGLCALAGPPSDLV